MICGPERRRGCNVGENVGANVGKDFVPAFYDENGILTMNVIDFMMEPKI
jgi:hypothetical protein